MKKVLFFLFITTTLVAQESVTKEVYQYSITPVTDSTWNLDVINIAVTPQQINRYANVTKEGIDKFFYEKLYNNYQVRASNGYRLLVEELKTASNESLLTNNLEYDYQAKSKETFKTSYLGRYGFFKTGSDPVIVLIDSVMNTVEYRVDTTYVSEQVPFNYESIVNSDSIVYDTIIADLDTIVNQTIIPVVKTVTNVGYNTVETPVVNNTMVKTKIYDIVPMSLNFFKLLVDTKEINMYSDDKKTWLGKDHETGEFYYLIKR